MPKPLGSNLLGSNPPPVAHRGDHSTAGLRVHAERDQGVYPTNLQVSDASIAAVGLLPRDFHGDWNYTMDRHP